jgi:hypothetical protein
MPATRTRDQGKTSFVKELLIDQPMANTKAVNEAWSAAGMEGSISETLVNKTRSSMGLAGNLRGKRATKTEASSSTKRAYTGKKRGRKPKQQTVSIGDGKAAPAGARAGKRNDRLVELESDLDRLLFRVMNEGELAQVEHSLREARRRLYAAFVTKH